MTANPSALEGDNRMNLGKITERTRPSRRPTVSREWVNAFASGDDVICTKPWTTLKVNLFHETKICCSFFTKLPRFDWPTAREFHDPNRMWNHPFMQHMRRTMRTPDEIPYCTLCMEKDKRDPHNKAELDEAIRKSLEIYRRFQPTNEFSGRIDSLKVPLSEWSFEVIHPLIGRVGTCQPYKEGKEQYRDLLKKFGFVGLGTILLPDVNPGGWRLDGKADFPMAPFLAEANEDLLVSGTGWHYASNLCRALDLKVTCVDASLGQDMQLKSSSVDGIWLKGRSLIEHDLGRTLGELRRVLRPGGTVHIRRGPGLGALLKLAADDTPAGDAMWSQASLGATSHRRLNYFSRRGMDAVLSDVGFMIDSRYPLHIQATTASNQAGRLVNLRSRDLAKWLSEPSSRDELRRNPDMLSGLEQFMSFNIRPT